MRSCPLVKISVLKTYFSYSHHLHEISMRNHRKNLLNVRARINRYADFNIISNIQIQSFQKIPELFHRLYGFDMKNYFFCSELGIKIEVLHRVRNHQINLKIKILKVRHPLLFVYYFFKIWIFNSSRSKRPSPV